MAQVLRIQPMGDDLEAVVEEVVLREGDGLVVSIRGLFMQFDPNRSSKSFKCWDNRNGSKSINVLFGREVTTDEAAKLLSENLVYNVLSICDAIAKGESDIELQFRLVPGKRAISS